jgi:hypothetical protein
MASKTPPGRSPIQVQWLLPLLDLDDQVKVTKTMYVDNASISFHYGQAADKKERFRKLGYVDSAGPRTIQQASLQNSPRFGFFEVGTHTLLNLGTWSI